MDDKKDQIIGRAKQAAGDLTDDDELHDEGERQETAGKAKELLDDAVDAVKDGIDSIRDRLDGKEPS